MSFLSKLNPFKWIKEALISDYVGGQLRHYLGILGTWLVSNADVPQSFADLLSSPDFVGGILAIILALVSSVQNKKVP